MREGEGGNEAKELLRGCASEEAERVAKTPQRLQPISSAEPNCSRRPTRSLVALEKSSIKLFQMLKSTLKGLGALKGL